MQNNFYNKYRIQYWKPYRSKENWILLLRERIRKKEDFNLTHLQMWQEVWACKASTYLTVGRLTEKYKNNKIQKGEQHGN